MSTKAQEVREDKITRGISDLPEGWCETTIEEVFDIKYGKGLKESNRRPGKVPVYGSNGVVGCHDQAITSGPTVVIGRKGTAGAVHYSNVPCWPIDTTYFIDDFRGLHQPYIQHWVRHLNLSTLRTSSPIPRLSRDDIYRQPVAIPPFAEQVRIATNIDILFCRHRIVSQRLSRAMLIVKNLRRAVLAAAASGKLTENWREHNATESGDLNLLNAILALRRSQSATWHFEHREPARPSTEDLPELPKEWSWASPDELVSGADRYTLGIGPFGKLKVSDYRPEGVPLVFVRNIRSGIFEDTKSISREKAGELRPHWVQAGDVLVTKMGDPPGDAALYESGRPLGVITADCIKLELSDLLSEPRFFVHAINSPLVRDQIVQITSGVVHPKVSLERFRKIALPLPPVEEQKEIVRLVEALFKLADQIERRIADACLRAESLTATILSKAFRGELVQTEAELARRERRAYEPAPVLLERIRAQRSEQALKNEAFSRPAISKQ